MKQKVFFMSFVMTLCLSCANSNVNTPSLSFIASNETLSDSIEAISFGFDIEGDSISFLDNREIVPLLSNTTKESSSNFVLGVEFDCSYDVTFSKYFIVDTVITKESEKQYILHYGKLTLDPYEKIPFPITKISNMRDTIGLCNLKYIPIINQNKRNTVQIIMIANNRKKYVKRQKLNSNQYHFMNISKMLLEFYKPEKIAFIYKDTIVPNLSFFEPLKNLSETSKLIELKK